MAKVFCEKMENIWAALCLLKTRLKALCRNTSE